MVVSNPIFRIAVVSAIPINISSLRCEIHVVPQAYRLETGRYGDGLFLPILILTIVPSPGLPVIGVGV